MYKKTKIISDNVSIDIRQVPEHELNYLCSSLLEAVQKYFEDPDNRRDYERWRKEQKEAKNEQSAEDLVYMRSSQST